MAYLDRLDPQPSKYIFFENNSRDNTLDVIRKFPRPKELIKIWFRDDAIQVLGNPYGAIALARQYLLKRARQLNPDYVIFIDDDVMVFYPHFIDQLMMRKRDIIGVPYLRNYEEGLALSVKWKRKNKKGIWLKKSCKGFQQCYVTSGGCLCLSRRVIQDKRINFYPLLWNGIKASEDFGYCIRARKYGFKIYVDCTLQAGHYADAYYYKPWLVKKDNKGYIDFSYGHEKEINEEILR